MSPYPFKTRPFEHQLKCWDVSKDREAFALLMDMGTGKTKVLIDTAAYLYDKGAIDSLVVIAPRGVYRNWQDTEIPAHMPDHVRCRVAAWASDPDADDRLALKLIEQRDAMNYLRVLLVNVEALSTKRAFEYVEKFLLGCRPIIAIDESTVIKHESSKRTKAVTYLGRYGRYLRIMSGEPAANSPLDLWSQFEFLRPGILGFSSFYSYKNHFAECVGPRDVRRLETIKGWRGMPAEELERRGFSRAMVSAVRRGAGKGYEAVLGYRNMDELQKLVGEHSFIVKKEDCLDLPAKIYQTRDVEMNEQQREAYKRMREECVVFVEELLAKKDRPALRQEPGIEFDDLQSCLFDEAEKDELCECPPGDDPLLSPVCPICNRPRQGVSTVKMSSAAIVITQLLRLHQIVCGFVKTDDGEEIDLGDTNPRLEELVEILRAHRGKAIVWATYRRSIRQIESRLAEEFGPDSVVTYYGGTKANDRRAAIKSFQDPRSPVKYFVANRSGAYGLTLTQADLVVYFSNDYDREVRGQSEDRCHRIGQTQHVTYVDLMCRKTVDEKIIKTLREKKKLSELITPSNWRTWFA
jgi:SNF2 family DNA or RNA helicase